MSREAIQSESGVGKRLFIVSIALIILAVLFNIARDTTLMKSIPTRESVSVKWAMFAVWLLMGFFVIRHSQKVLLDILTKRGRTDSRVRFVVMRTFSSIGYIFVAMEALHLLHIQLTGILLGGAFTGVIVGMAAQSTLSNFFAGVVLFSLKPFRIHQTVIIRSSLFGGVEYTGTVVDVNWFYTKIVNGEGQIITIPNSSAVVAVVTMIAKEGVQTYSIPMSYSVSISDLKREIAAEIGEEVSVVIRNFEDTTYTVQILLPTHMDREVLREVIYKLKEPS